VRLVLIKKTKVYLYYLKEKKHKLTIVGTCYMFTAASPTHILYSIIDSFDSTLLRFCVLFELKARAETSTYSVMASKDLEVPIFAPVWTPSVYA